MQGLREEPGLLSALHILGWLDPGPLGPAAWEPLWTSTVPQRAFSSASASKGVGLMARGLLYEFHLQKKIIL